MPVQAGQSDVAVALGTTEQELVRIEAAWFDGRQVEVRHVYDLDDLSLSDWTTATGHPRVVVQVSPFTIRLYPVPEHAAAKGLKVRASVRPSESATGIPDDLGAKFRDELAIGAKARLLLQTGAPWANPEMGALLARMFDEHISAANLTTVRSFGRGRLNTKPNWF
jgi:hypothetical protein